MKQARDLLGRVGADVEPDRAVEREVLVDQQPGQLVLEQLGVGRRREVAVVLAALAVALHDPIDELLEPRLPGVGALGAAEVLRRDDGRGVDRPEVGELDAALLEDGLAGLPVGLDDVAPLPGDLVVGVHAVGAEPTLDGQTFGRAQLVGGPAHRLGHTVSPGPNRPLIILLGTDTARDSVVRVARYAASPRRTGRSVGQPLGAEERSSDSLSRRAASCSARCLRRLAISISKSSAVSNCLYTAAKRR